jgi:hypothetical protein
MQFVYIYWGITSMHLWEVPTSLPLLPNTLNNNSLAWVHERTIPTERLLLVGEVSVNVLRIQGSTWPYYILNLNSVASVRERAILTEQPQLVDEVSVNFCGYRLPRCQRDGSLRPYSRISRLEPLLFISSGSSIVHTRRSGPRSRPTTSQRIW